MKSNYIIEKVKKATKRILVCGLAISLSGCVDNLLNTSPYDQVGSSTMWTTETYVEAGMASIYAVLREGYSNGTTGHRTLWELDQFGMATVARTTQGLSVGTATESTGLFSYLWKAQYTGISRANDCITNMPERAPISDELIAKYIAEAKFLRAYYYFRLNQVWKGVPVYLQETSLDEMYGIRSSEAEVWDVIIKDLTDAINETNLPDKYAAGDKNYGRVTRGAAYALRGKAYLYMKEYAKAVADFEKVASCGYGLFKGDYYELFKEKNEQCEEMIFSIQHVGINGYGSSIQLHYGSRSAIGSNWNSFYASNDIVDLYENKDGSSFSWDDYIPGYSSLTPTDRQVFFLRDTVNLKEKYPEITQDMIQKIRNDVDTILIKEISAEARALYLSGKNEERIKSIYMNRDPRLAANVITPYSEFKGYISNQPTMVTMRWPYYDEGAPVNDLKTDSSSEFYYLHRKFVYEGDELDNNDSRAYGPTDFPIIRYADVLLMWAEALAESEGLNNKSIELINQVRDRVNMPLLNSGPSALAVNSKENLIERIRNERRYEFVNEGINYFDELRWGTLKDKVFYQGNGKKQIFGRVQTPFVWGGDNYYTWPIPLSEIQFNNKLEQNKGWKS